MHKVIDYHNGVIAVDAHYIQPRLAAIHLLIEGDQAAIIDTGVNSSVPGILSALQQYRLRPEQVRYIILTHIHLDHAGGTGELLQHLPNARVVVHPRGSRHLIEPGKLIAGTIAVYGAEKTARLYGEIKAVPGERIIEARHEDSLTLNGRELLLLDTPGHALHHICIVDRQTSHIFTGDTFGLSYRQLDNHGRQFMFATTTPVQFDPETLYASIDLLCSYRPEAMYLTHFSQIRDIPSRAGDLKTCLQSHVEIARAAGGKGQERIEAIKAGLVDWVMQQSKLQDWALQGDSAVSLLAMDIELNAQGLDVWLSRIDKA
jgi:glyoxylase-like metal-dependent hydrolase (beta-lactamase superfamily II)